MGIGFAPVRKKGKLPREVLEYVYEHEYGTITLTMHKDAIKPGQRFLTTDAILSTGGRRFATIKLVDALCGIVVGIVVLIYVQYLNGKELLEGYDSISLIR